MLNKRNVELNFDNPSLQSIWNAINLLELRILKLEKDMVREGLATESSFEHFDTLVDELSKKVETHCLTSKIEDNV